MRLSGPMHLALPGYHIYFHTDPHILHPNSLQTRNIFTTQAFLEIMIRIRHYMPELLPPFLSDYLDSGPIRTPPETESRHKCRSWVGTIRPPQSRQIGKYLKFLTQERIARQSIEMNRNLGACDPARFIHTLGQKTDLLGETLIHNTETHMYTWLSHQYASEWRRVRKVLTPKKRKP